MTDAQQVNTTPWRRDPAALGAGLTAWARSVRGDGVELTAIRAPDSGMANDTVLFRLDGDALVARLAPAPDSAYPTFPTFDLAFQKRAIDLVRARTSVPVPEIVAFEPSDEWLGVPFLVVRAVEGNVPCDSPPYLFDSNGWFLRGTLEDWKRLESSTVAVFVQLHTIVDDSDATAFLRADAPGTTALARLLASHREYYEWARDGNTIPILERAFAVLNATLPANDRSVLLWGDGRPGNIIYQDFEPAAVLDWEMAGVGPPEVDVAWTTFFHRFFAHMGTTWDLGPVVPMFDRVETAATYARLGGAPLDDLAWYEALAAYRFGIILARMSLRSLAYAHQDLPDEPDDLVMFAPLLEQLLQEIS